MASSPTPFNQALSAPPTKAEPNSSNHLQSRTVQFSTPNTPTSLSMSPTSRFHHQQEQQAESSADEITPIVSRERGSAKSKNYDTTRPTLEDGVEATRPSSVSGVRKRKCPSNQAVAAGAQRDEGKGNGRWWNDLVEKYGSVELDNKGSVARDHLALERTFLAWLRTSLAFASIGIAVTQLFRLNTTITRREGYEPKKPESNFYHLRQVGKPLGVTFLGIAILVLLTGGRRYFESQYWIIRGKFPASRGSVFLITFIALILIVTSLVVVCAVDPSAFEKK